jgi:hypothetical protein
VVAVAVAVVVVAVAVVRVHNGRIEAIGCWLLAIVGYILF